VLRIAQTRDANDPPNPHRNPPDGRRIAGAAPPGAPAWVSDAYTRGEITSMLGPQSRQAGAATPWESRTLTFVLTGVPVGR